MSGAPSAALYGLRPDLGSMEQFDLERNRRGMIAYRVAKVINVDRQAGSWGKIKLESLLRNPDVSRTSRSGYKRDTWEFEDAQFATVERGLEQVVDDRDAARYSAFFDAEAKAARLSRAAVLQAAEARVAALIINGTTWNGASLTTAVSNWSTTGKPIVDIDAARLKIWTGSGELPNALVVTFNDFLILRNNASILDRIAAQGAGSKILPENVNETMLASVLDLEEIIVAKTLKRTTLEGSASATPASVWTNGSAMLCKVARTDDMEEPCIARTFHWTGDDSELDCVMEMYRDDTARANIVRARHDVQEQVVYKECGHLITGIA